MSAITGELCQCPDCGSMVSIHAKGCAQCGRPKRIRNPRCSRIVYLILALFFGMIGVHNFAAGRFISGSTQLVLTLLFAFTIPLALLPILIWVIVEICAVSEDGDGVPMD
jgi:TM2 domain-containing membrane protein YozV